jgi:hypothetical protein
MPFTNLRKLHPGGVSKQWDPHDRGENLPSPIVCDSVLDFSKVNETTYAELTIYFKVWFEPLSSSVGQTMDGNHNWFKVLDWEPQMDFPSYGPRVAQAANETWDNKLLLTLPERYNGLDWEGKGGVWRPQVRCRFVCLIGDPTYHHAHVQVAHVEHAENWRNCSRRWSHWAATEKPRETQALGWIPQVPGVHELGHLMGQPHIGELTSVQGCHLWTSTGAAACYAAEDPNPLLASNIMGCGMQVSAFNALPWKQELCKHANQDEWSGHLSPGELTATTDLSKGPTRR